MGILDLGRYKGIVFAITGFLVFIAIILAVNHGKAGQFSDDVSAVKFLAEQREQPGAVYAAGVELAARLKNGQKIDEPLEALRKAAKSYDNALSSLANGGMITDSTGNVFVVPALTDRASAGRARQRHQAVERIQGQARSGAAFLRLAVRGAGSDCAGREAARSNRSRCRSARAVAACRRPCRISIPTVRRRTRSCAT